MNFRYRIHYAKTSSLRYTSNLDIHKIWERIFRRAQLPLAYSQGYHPQPKIQQANPLPLGFLSQDEILDFYLSDDLDIQNIQECLEGKLPEGIQIQSIEQITEKEPALQVQLKSSLYRIEFLDPVMPEWLKNSLEEILSKKEIIRIRRKKEYDLRPLIESVQTEVKTNSQPELIIQLSSREGATGRPEEVLSELGIALQDTRIIRIKTILGNQV